MIQFIKLICFEGKKVMNLCRELIVGENKLDNLLEWFWSMAKYARD
jgi:hypothetical protein